MRRLSHLKLRTVRVPGTAPYGRTSVSMSSRENTLDIEAGPGRIKHSENGPLLTPDGQPQNFPGTNPICPGSRMPMMPGSSEKSARMESRSWLGSEFDNDRQTRRLSLPRDQRQRRLLTTTASSWQWSP